MKLQIIHETEYSFETPVLLDPHVLRLKPRHLQSQQLTFFKTDIQPTPAGLSEELDAEGNVVQFAWFREKTSGLRIVAKSMVNIRRQNDFNFIVYPFRSARLPAWYPADDKKVLEPSLKPASDDLRLKQFAGRLAVRHADSLVGFVNALFLSLSEYVEQQIRETGAVLSPSITFKRKSGSCRDLAWLAIALLRMKGLAARFVSGYFYDAGLAGHELHAWVEVFIPGAGWRGYDPTTGFGINQKYVSVAGSAWPAHTLPVTGVYRGPARSELNTRVHISRQ